MCEYKISYSDECSSFQVRLESKLEMNVRGMTENRILRLVFAEDLELYTYDVTLGSKHTLIGNGHTFIICLCSSHCNLLIYM